MRIVLLLAACLFSFGAFADVGIPVVSYGWPLMIANLAAVVLIEVLVVKAFRKSLTWGKTFKQVFIANLITTFIGYPLVAVVEGLSPVVGLNLGWLLPFSNLEQMHLYVSLATFLTLVPCYFLSVWVEGKWMRRRLSADLRWKEVYLANLASYALLTAEVFALPPRWLIGFGAYTFEPFYKVVMMIASLFVKM